MHQEMHANMHNMMGCDMQKACQPIHEAKPRERFIDNIEQDIYKETQYSTDRLKLTECFNINQNTSNCHTIDEQMPNHRNSNMFQEQINDPCSIHHEICNDYHDISEVKVNTCHENLTKGESSHSDHEKQNHCYTICGEMHLGTTWSYSNVNSELSKVCSDTNQITHVDSLDKTNKYPKINNIQIPSETITDVVLGENWNAKTLDQAPYRNELPTIVIWPPSETDTAESIISMNDSIGDYDFYKHIQRDITKIATDNCRMSPDKLVPAELNTKSTRVTFDHGNCAEHVDPKYVRFLWAGENGHQNSNENESQQQLRTPPEIRNVTFDNIICTEHHGAQHVNIISVASHTPLHNGSLSTTCKDSNLDDKISQKTNIEHQSNNQPFVKIDTTSADSEPVSCSMQLNHNPESKITKHVNMVSMNEENNNMGDNRLNDNFQINIEEIAADNCGTASLLANKSVELNTETAPVVIDNGNCIEQVDLTYVKLLCTYENDHEHSNETDFQQQLQIMPEIHNDTFDNIICTEHHGVQDHLHVMNIISVTSSTPVLNRSISTPCEVSNLVHKISQEKNIELTRTDIEPVLCSLQLNHNPESKITNNVNLISMNGENNRSVLNETIQINTPQVSTDKSQIPSDKLLFANVSADVNAETIPDHENLTEYVDQMNVGILWPSEHDFPLKFHTSSNVIFDNTICTEHFGADVNKIVSTASSIPVNTTSISIVYGDSNPANCNSQASIDHQQPPIVNIETTTTDCESCSYQVIHTDSGSVCTNCSFGNIVEYNNQSKTTELNPDGVTSEKNTIHDLSRDGRLKLNTNDWSNLHLETIHERNEGEKFDLQIIGHGTSIGKTSDTESEPRVDASMTGETETSICMLLSPTSQDNNVVSSNRDENLYKCQIPGNEGNYNRPTSHSVEDSLPLKSCLKSASIDSVTYVTDTASHVSFASPLISNIIEIEQQQSSQDTLILDFDDDYNISEDDENYMILRFLGCTIGKSCSINADSATTLHVSDRDDSSDQDPIPDQVGPSINAYSPENQTGICDRMKDGISVGENHNNRQFEENLNVTILHKPIPEKMVTSNHCEKQSMDLLHPSMVPIKGDNPVCVISESRGDNQLSNLSSQMGCQQFRDLACERLAGCNEMGHLAVRSCECVSSDADTWLGRDKDHTNINTIYDTVQSTSISTGIVMDIINGLIMGVCKAQKASINFTEPIVSSTLISDTTPTISNLCDHVRRNTLFMTDLSVSVNSTPYAQLSGDNAVPCSLDDYINQRCEDELKTISEYSPSQEDEDESIRCSPTVECVGFIHCAQIDLSRKHLTDGGIMDECLLEKYSQELATPTEESLSMPQLPDRSEASIELSEVSNHTCDNQCQDNGHQERCNSITKQTDVLPHINTRLVNLSGACAGVEHECLASPPRKIICVDRDDVKSLIRLSSAMVTMASDQTVPFDLCDTTASNAVLQQESHFSGENETFYDDNPTGISKVPSAMKVYHWNSEHDLQCVNKETQRPFFQVHPLRTCAKPLRIGLSKRQRLKPLHPKLSGRLQEE